ncbi:MAG: ATP-binding protein [Gemmatimonadaceae bacterium]
MIESVRVRLALWHTAIVAVLLLALSIAAYNFIAQMSARRFDQYLEETAAAFRIEYVAQRYQTPTDFAAAAEALAEFEFRDLDIGVIDLSGQVVAITTAPGESQTTGDEVLQPFDPAPLGRMIGGRHLTRPEFVTLPDRRGGVRVCMIPVEVDERSYVIVVARPLVKERAMLESVRAVLLLVLPTALLLVAVGGYLLTRRSLSPVIAMTEHASHMGTSTLHERLPVPNVYDEYGQLATVINGLLSRIESAFEHQRRFMADASHELRTPISIIRGEADIALAMTDRPPQEYREALSVVRAEARRLSRIVHDLFLLARADAGQQPLQLREFYLDEVISDCAHIMRSLASRRGISLTSDVSSEAAVRGDEDMVRRLIHNLLDNALKYGTEGGCVEIALRNEPGCYRVIVRDSGPGISTEIAAHIFDRFYRGDHSRERESAPHTENGEDSAGVGAGLGLAIARWIAEAHGGSLVLAHTAATGSEFVFTLPDLGEH